MKNIFKKSVSFIVAAVLLIPTFNTYADEHVFVAKKTAVRISGAGETVECIVSATERNFFSYKAQIVYDSDLLEFVEADPVYIQGEPEDILYMSQNLPEGLAYNVPKAKVYRNNEALCGYYGQEPNPGIFRSISTIMGFEGRSEGDEVLKVTFKSKKGGDGFIYLMDEETALLNEDKTVSNNVSETVFTVKVGDSEFGATKIWDKSEVAYPWRKSETTIFQQTTDKAEIEDTEIAGEEYSVSYANKDADIKVYTDGTVVCTIPMDKASDYCPVVARKGAFGDLKRVNRIKYDFEGKKLTFAVDDFGDYVISDTNYVLTDCAVGSDEYKAVRYLKSIGVVDENAKTFEPNRSITKAEFIKMLVCCMGKADESALVWIKDVTLSDWYYKYIATAAKKGIIIDDEGYFNPTAPLTSVDAERMLQKASEIINGDGELYFNKTGNLTRGEAAVAIQNMLWTKLK